MHPGTLMAYDRSIHLLGDGGIVVECGPMRVKIDTRIGNVPQQEEAVKAADEAVRYLEGIAKSRPLLGRGYARWLPFITDPLARKMVASVQKIGDPDLTPMAAVAGTIADAIADFLFERGATRVLVDNGGDVAIRCRDGMPVTVGIRPSVAAPDVSQLILLGPEQEAWGIATSGLGGRSLTRGVVDAATVVAKNASIADAAATAIANASFLNIAAVIRKPAESIDPYTDISGLEVTTAVGPLGDDDVQEAINRAIRKAEALAGENIILGAYVAFRSRMAITPFLLGKLRATGITALR
jgi:uncharacterized protein